MKEKIENITGKSRAARAAGWVLSHFWLMATLYAAVLITGICVVGWIYGK